MHAPNDKVLQLHTGNAISSIGLGCAAWGTDLHAAPDLFDTKFKTAYTNGYQSVRGSKLRGSVVIQADFSNERFYDCAEEYGRECAISACRRKLTFLPIIAVEAGMLRPRFPCLFFLFHLWLRQPLTHRWGI